MPKCQMAETKINIRARACQHAKQLFSVTKTILIQTSTTPIGGITSIFPIKTNKMTLPNSNSTKTDLKKSSNKDNSSNHNFFLSKIFIPI
jgi:hypothetical protein